MLKFFRYESLITDIGEKHVHRCGSGHGVRELLAGEGIRKVPRRGSALSTLQHEEAFLLPQAPEALRGLARAGTGNRSAKVSFFHIRSREKSNYFCFCAPLAWKEEAGSRIKRFKIECDMKIIEEIEKSRLTDENMASITGGMSAWPERCANKEVYQECFEKYYTQECMVHRLDCGVYWYCNQKSYWESPCRGYGECNNVKQQPLVQLA